jgi:(p)ppGpp synthase/HD superfamily hydrolase
MESTVDRALRVALSVHAGQTDKGGNPYILHPLRICKRLQTSDQELMAIALLHDTVEDSEGKVTLETLAQEGFSYRVINAIDLLTHPEGMDYMDYIRRLQGNPDAVRVKMQDLRDNSDITRLKGLTEKDFARLTRYSIAYDHLKKWGAK